MPDDEERDLAQGFSYKSKLTINFMKRKMKEYDELKKELKNNK